MRTVREYAIARNRAELSDAKEALAKDGVEAEPMIAIGPIPAYCRGEHFAVREDFAPHPCGNGLWLRCAQVDHIPTGYRCFGGDSICGASENECNAWIDSALTAPVDWAAVTCEGTSPEVTEFLQEATRRAHRGETIAWVEWIDSKGADDDQG